MTINISYTFARTHNIPYSRRKLGTPCKDKLIYLQDAAAGAKSAVVGIGTKEYRIEIIFFPTTFPFVQRRRSLHSSDVRTVMDHFQLRFRRQTRFQRYALFN